jgi:hypothetical protein
MGFEQEESRQQAPQRKMKVLKAVRSGNVYMLGMVEEVVLKEAALLAAVAVVVELLVVRVHRKR